jgi:hypothetical protein
MNNLIPLMRREWLQHRFVWAMLTLVPLGLAVMLLSFGQVEMGDAMASARETAAAGPSEQ